MPTLTNENSLEFIRLLTLHKALYLEIKGMKRRGKSAYSIIKNEFGFKGNKQKVFDQMTEKLKEYKEEKDHA